MKSIKFLGLLAFLVMLTSAIPNTKVFAETNSKRYVILIEQEDGTWLESTGLEKIDNKMYISTSVFFNLGYKCFYEGPYFSIITNVEKYLANERQYGDIKVYDIVDPSIRIEMGSFTVGSCYYTFKEFNTGKKVKKKMDAETGVYKVHISALKSFVKSYKYVRIGDAPEFKKLGYQGILCISNYNKVTKVPSSKKIMNLSIGSIEIGGKELPVLERFNSWAIYKDGWWNDLATSKLSTLFKRTLLVLPGCIQSSSAVHVTENNIHLYPSYNEQECAQLYKLRDRDAYGLLLEYGPLPKDGGKNDESKRTYCELVKGVLTVITSTPEEVYKAIQNDSNNGKLLKSGEWLIVGDCKIKAEPDDRGTLYLIKSK